MFLNKNSLFIFGLHKLFLVLKPYKDRSDKLDRGATATVDAPTHVKTQDKVNSPLFS